MQPGLFREGWIGCSFRKPLARVLFVVGLCLALIPLGYKAVRVAAGGVFGAFQKPADLRWALEFDPANPRLYERLGLAYQLIDQTSLNPAGEPSVPWLRKAVALEPRNGLYWESLGQACENAGDEHCATASFARALTLNPMTPEIEWLAANDDLRWGSRGKAAAHFRRLVEIDPQYAGEVFSTCLRAYGDAQFVGQHVLPPRTAPALKLAYVRFLAQQGDFQSAAQFWNDLVSSHAKFNYSIADPYVEMLLASGQIAQAARVWRNLRQLGILQSGDEAEPGNLIFNPGFERIPLNTGFGWRFQNVPYVDVRFADPSAHQGKSCVRIDFTFPENQAAEPVYQLVPVAASQGYTLSAWVRSEGLTSNTGPRLRVVDPQHPGCVQAETEDVLGTTPWHKVSVTFSTCSKAQLIRLSVWRPRGHDFPNTISGHFWLDDVTLVPRATVGNL